MTQAKVVSFVASTYVRDLDRSRAFYGALGFAESRSGRNEVSGWSYLNRDGHLLLLVTSNPPTDIPPLPLLFYFFVDDLAAASASMEAAGTAVDHVGYPPHAPGGEARVLDPDGNTVLVGQPVKSDDQPSIPEAEPGQHFSLLREAAALAQHRMGADRRCEVVNVDGACQATAAVKLADTWGDSAWACLPHAEIALINAPAAFIANQESDGLGSFLAAQRRVS